MPPNKKPLTFKQQWRKRLKQAQLIQFGAYFASKFVIFVRQTWRVDTLTHPQTQRLLDTDQPVIYALWHGRMFCLLRSINPEKTAILISASNDGEFITQTVRPLGFKHFIRGSSKKKGIQAARAIVQAVQDLGLSVATTIDGPMGPRYQVKPSLARLSSQLQIPVVPVCASASPCLFWLRRSWDHYMGPGLFSRLTITLGQPFYPQQPQAATHPDTDYTDTIAPQTVAIEAVLNRSTALLDIVHGHGAYWG